MKTLNNLPSISKKRKRVGRGGSRGGTSGKGHKGQKARSGPAIGPVFEGGQMPLTRRLPKRGFTNAKFKVEYEVINLGQLNVFDAGAVIDRESLIKSGLIKKSAKSVIKILAHGKLDKKLIVHADAFSGTAADMIKQKGGEVHVTKEK